MIVLFTDFGRGPYTAQMRAVILQCAPSQPVIELLDNAPRYNMRASAYLLAALSEGFPPGTVFVCVVDPGVGGKRPPVVLSSGGRWFVGPWNGLFDRIVLASTAATVYEIDTAGMAASDSFHGRDVFAPVAAQIALDRPWPKRDELPAEPVYPEWPLDLPEVIYFDDYGNAWTGIRAQSLHETDRLEAAGESLAYARTFCEQEAGKSFWYRNSSGLVEIAVNQGSAQGSLGLTIGSVVRKIQASTSSG